jgi:uncharacterized membrane protein
MPLCSRCFGFYIGLIIGLVIPIIFYWIYQIEIMVLFWIMIIGLTPMAIDGISQFFGLRVSNNNLRFTTGIMAGLVLGILFNWLGVHILFLD